MKLFDNHKNSVYNLWKTLNPIISLKNGKSFSVINKLKNDRNVVVDKHEIWNSMNEHFCDIGMKLQSEIPDYGYKHMDYMPQRIVNSFYLEPITVDDILIEMQDFSIINLLDMISLQVKLFKYVQIYLPLIYLKYTTAVLRTANIPTS